jgi:hypothetical protein
MTKRLTPQQKKKLEYTKDHYVIAEYPHSFRRTWPKKKQRANQAYRHHVRQALGAADQDKVSGVAQRPYRRPKWGVVSLGERVALRRRKLGLRLGWNFFKSPYQSQYHRESFAAFLHTLMAEKSGEALDHARAVQGWLTPSQELTPWLPHRDRY